MLDKVKIFGVTKTSDTAAMPAATVTTFAKVGTAAAAANGLCRYMDC